MSCVCEHPHDDNVEPVTYRNNEEYLPTGRRNPYYGKLMVSHLVCRQCMGNICVSDMTLHDYYYKMPYTGHDSYTW